MCPQGKWELVPLTGVSFHLLWPWPSPSEDIKNNESQNMTGKREKDWRMRWPRHPHSCKIWWERELQYSFSPFPFSIYWVQESWHHLSSEQSVQSLNGVYKTQSRNGDWRGGRDAPNGEENAFLPHSLCLISWCLLFTIPSPFYTSSSRVILSPAMEQSSRFPAHTTHLPLYLKPWELSPRGEEWTDVSRDPPTI